MPEIMTEGDSLREYLTGAASDGATSTQEASLGGHRSSVEVASFSLRLDGTPKGVKILYASGGNGVGVGRLGATTSSKLFWTAPDDAAGVEVDFPSAGTKVVPSGTPGRFLRVTGTPPFETGVGLVSLLSLFNGVLGMNDATASGSKYRAVMLKNVSAGTLTAVKRWVGTLGTQRISSAAQLGASGAGTITVAGSLADWPLRGWAQIRQSGGTLREVVYYSSRTDSSLVVPTDGRARLGTTAVAGGSSDVIYSVPGVAIAAAVGGVVNSGIAAATVADEDTEPAGVSWSLGILSTDAVVFGTMTTGQQAALWVWRDVPSGALGSPAHTVKLNGSFAY